MKTDTVVADAQDKQVVAGLFSFVGGLIYREPARDVLEEWASDGLLSCVPVGIDDEDMRTGFDLMGRWMRDYAAGDADDAVRQLQREWLRLFVGVGEPEVPSWSNYYLDADQRTLGRETLRVRDIYRSCGMRIQGMSHEPDDNLGLMLQFTGHLVAREAAAEATHDSDEAASLRETQTVLLKDHVLPWLSRWRYLGIKHADSDFYRGAVLMTFGLIRWWAARLGFAYKPENGSFTLGKDI